MMVAFVVYASAQEPVDEVNAGATISLSVDLQKQGYVVQEFSAIKGANHAARAVLALAMNKKLPVNVLVTVYGRNDVVLGEQAVKVEDLEYEGRQASLYVVDVIVPVHWIRRVEIKSASGR